MAQYYIKILINKLAQTSKFPCLENYFTYFVFQHRRYIRLLCTDLQYDEKSVDEHGLGAIAGGSSVSLK